MAESLPYGGDNVCTVPMELEDGCVPVHVALQLKSEDQKLQPPPLVKPTLASTPEAPATRLSGACAVFVWPGIEAKAKAHYAPANSF